MKQCYSIRSFFRVFWYLIIIVWGSDYPVVNAGKGIQEWIKVTHTILGNLSDDEAKIYCIS